jgi:hypothetical protein
MRAFVTRSGHRPRPPVLFPSSLRLCTSAVNLVFLIATASQAAEPTHAIVRHDAKHIKAVLEFEVDVPDAEVVEWTVFVPVPPSLPCQHGISAKFEPGGIDYTELSDRHRRLLRTIVPTKGKSKLVHHFAGKAEYEATLVARKLVERTPGTKYPSVPKLTAESRAVNLQTSPLYDFESATFTDWLKEEELYRRKNESELGFARRAFLALKSEFTYDYQAEMNRAASNVCEVGKSDCGGLAVLYASVMRANEIPARALAGCWAKSSKPGATLNGVRYNQVHIKAEVYVTDIGWIPIDLSSAINHDKTPEGLHYFGNDPGDFLTMHVDPEIKVDTIRFGEKTFNWLQQYHYYTYGKGKLTNTDYKITWTVE